MGDYFHEFSEALRLYWGYYLWVQLIETKELFVQDLTLKIIEMRLQRMMHVDLTPGEYTIN